MNEQDEAQWIIPRSKKFKYTPALSCPFCKGNIIYIYDDDAYYLGGHTEECIFFGRGLEFESMHEMKKYWENRNDSR